MKIINPHTEILTPLDGQAILQHIELCGRVCYKSEDKITDTSAAKFVAGEHPLLQLFQGCFWQ